MGGLHRWGALGGGSPWLHVYIANCAREGEPVGSKERALALQVRSCSRSRLQ